MGGRAGGGARGGYGRIGGVSLSKNQMEFAQGIMNGPSRYGRVSGQQEYHIGGGKYETAQGVANYVKSNWSNLKGFQAAIKKNGK